MAPFVGMPSMSTANSPLVAWLFQRIIALVYLAAFASLYPQIVGLVGSDGILPAAEYLDRLENALGGKALWQVPTLFWFNCSDAALESACLVGMAASLLVLSDRFNRVGLLVCYALYLSLVGIGQTFTAFQWDMFLLESGFLAMFLAGGSPIVVWLYRFLLFRFMLLTISLCVFLLQDSDVRPLLGGRLCRRILGKPPPSGMPARLGAGAVALFSLLVCGTLLWISNTHQRPFQPLYGLAQIASAFGLVNGYGPFAVMTTERREIIVEGSDDGQTWRPYEFKYKPGELTKPLGWNIPHQPRLDRQMWFAALGSPRSNPWFLNFMGRLREGSGPVLALLQYNPFHDHPPKYLRAGFYRYRFSTREERAASGEIWRREPLGDYLPAY